MPHLNYKYLFRQTVLLLVMCGYTGSTIGIAGNTTVQNTQLARGQQNGGLKAQSDDEKKLGVLKGIQAMLVMELKAQEIDNTKRSICLKDYLLQNESVRSDYFGAQKANYLSNRSPIVKKYFGNMLNKDDRAKKAAFCNEFLNLTYKSRAIKADSDKDIATKLDNQSIQFILSTFRHMRISALMALGYDVVTPDSGKDKQNRFTNYYVYYEPEQPLKHLFNKLELDFLNRDLPNAGTLSTPTTEERKAASKSLNSWMLNSLNLVDERLQKIETRRSDYFKNQIAQLDMDSNMGQISDADYNAKKENLLKDRDYVTNIYKDSAAQNAKRMNALALWEGTDEFKSQGSQAYFKTLGSMPFLAFFDINRKDYEAWENGWLHPAKMSDSILRAFDITDKIRAEYIETINKMSASNDYYQLLYFFGLSGAVELYTKNFSPDETVMKWVAADHFKKTLVNAAGWIGSALGIGLVCALTTFTPQGKFVAVISALAASKLFLCTIGGGVGFNLASLASSNVYYRENFSEVFATTGISLSESRLMIQDLTLLNAGQIGLAVETLLLPVGNGIGHFIRESTMAARSKIVFEKVYKNLKSRDSSRNFNSMEHQ
jgi:hypothetical protein